MCMYHMLFHILGGAVYTTRGRRINDLSLATTNKMWSSDHLSFSVQ